MERKPDMIRALLLVFAIGLVISGFTTIHASEDEALAAPPLVEPTEYGLVRP